MCKYNIPNFVSVNLCLKALKHQLPKDLALQMIGRWYTVRTSPGGVGSQSEWSLFITCLLIMMGYDTSKLAFTNKVRNDWQVTCMSIICWSGFQTSMEYIYQ